MTATSHVENQPAEGVITEIPCEKCGTQMREVLRLAEGRAEYVWYQCDDNSCGHAMLIQYG